MSVWLAQFWPPRPPGRSSTLMPLSVVPLNSGPVPLAAWPGRVITLRPVWLTANSVAKGAPRVSGDRPRSGWKVLTKSRSEPRSLLASRTASVASTLKPSLSRLPMPPVNDAV